MDTMMVYCVNGVKKLELIEFRWQTSRLSLLLYFQDVYCATISWQIAVNVTIIVANSKKFSCPSLSISRPFMNSSSAFGSLHD